MSLRVTVETNWRIWVIGIGIGLDGEPYFGLALGPWLLEVSRA